MWLINLIDILSTATEYVLGICILIFLPLIIFKKTRPILGVILIWSTYLFGFTLWLISLVISLKYAGVVWVIIGLMLAGVGVLPIAIISSAIQADWFYVIYLIVFFAIIIFIRILGSYLVNRYAVLTYK